MLESCLKGALSHTLPPTMQGDWQPLKPMCHEIKCTVSSSQPEESSRGGAAPFSGDAAKRLRIRSQGMPGIKKGLHPWKNRVLAPSQEKEEPRLPLSSALVGLT